MSGSNTLPSAESLKDVVGAESAAYPGPQEPGRTTVYESSASEDDYERGADSPSARQAEAFAERHDEEE